MPTLYTIGYERRPLREFIGLLRQAGVDAVIDIRLRNTSQLAGYTKRDDLAFLLPEGFAIAYEHHPDLAPTDAILDGYHEDHDWQRYVALFTALLGERQAEELVEAGEVADPAVPPVPGHALIELVPRQEVQQLREDRPSRVHRPSLSWWNRGKYRRKHAPSPNRKHSRRLAS